MKHKLLTLLVYCLTMFFIFAGGGPASAYTSEKVMSVAAVKPDSTTSLGTLLIKEEYANSIKEGDCLTISLPSYVELRKISIYFPGGSSYLPSVTGATYSAGGFVNPGEVTLGDSGIIVQKEDKNRFTLKVNDDWGTTTKTFRCYVYFDKVDIEAGAPRGDEVKATLEGSGGFNSNVQTLAKITDGSDMLAAAGTLRSITGKSGRIAAITITENAPGALKYNAAYYKKHNTVKLVLPAGFSWIKNGTWLMTSWGFKKYDVTCEVDVDSDGRSVLYLKVFDETDSTTDRGRVTVIGYVAVDESIAKAGKVEVSYEGNNAGVSPTVLAVADYGAGNGLAVQETGIATAPAEKKTGAVFTIDSQSYEIDGKKQEMDVAPYTKNDRTYGPVRYIAYALGITDQDIIWDEAAQTVTLRRGEQVVQLKVGRASVINQGAETPIDAAPELVEPGRVMLPYRWVAFALDANVSWSEEKQQVTIQTK